MMELPVRNRDGQVVGTAEIDEADFGGQVRHEVLRQAILMYEAAKRVGTAATKTRGQVKATRSKPWRQKGTGRARAGFRRSPLWRGGGIVFGPSPRDYRFTMPRKAIRAATRSAYLTKFLADGATIVLDELSIERPRTREIAATLSALGVDRGCLIAIAGHDANLWRSARNIPGVFMKPVADVNAYDLLHRPKLVITRAALDNLVSSMRRREPEKSDQAAPVAENNG